jgi:hypothetical protein
MLAHPSPASAPISPVCVLVWVVGILRRGRMREMIRSLLSSKKAVAAIAGVIVIGASRAGIVLPPEATHDLVAVVVAYLIGQGLADVGKEAAKAENHG